MGLLEHLAADRGIALRECFDDPGPLPVAPEEAVLLGSEPTPERRLHFHNGRWCAHRALARLGRDVRALRYRETGQPWTRRAVAWPAGVVGSITHCAGYQAAAAAPTAVVAALGIDAEPALQLPAAVRATTAPTSMERARIRDLAAHDPGVAWDRLAFCAKEAAFKAWSCQIDAWLDFADCVVLPDPGGVMDIRLSPAAAGRWSRVGKPLTGRWAHTLPRDRSPGLVAVIVSSSP